MREACCTTCRGRLCCTRGSTRPARCTGSVARSQADGPPACRRPPPSRPHPRAPREAYCTTGYSPVLAFDVEDLQATLVRCLQQGATMDGSIQHSSHGKVGGQVAWGGGRVGCFRDSCST